MTKAYKHIKKSLARKFVNGRSIQICTQQYYRDRYESMGVRGDPHEGACAIRNGSALIFAGQATPEQVEFVRRTRLVNPDALPNINIVIENCTFTELVNEHYIFCASTEPDWSKIDDGDEIIEISDFESFAASLSTNCAPDGVSLSHFEIGNVFYDDIERDLLDNSPVLKSPFIKHSRFKPENEIRICWNIERSISKPPENYIFSCALAAKYMRICSGSSDS